MASVRGLRGSFVRKNHNKRRVSVCDTAVDHNYVGADVCDGEGQCLDSNCPFFNNINLGKNAERFGWKEGRRVIELDVLLTSLKSCTRCVLGPIPLTYVNFVGELRKGLGGFLYVKCQNPECGEINKAPYGKMHHVKARGMPCFVVNTKVRTSMIDSIGGPNRVNNFLSTLNIKPINSRSLKAMENRAGVHVENVANMGTKKAADESFHMEMEDIAQEESLEAQKCMGESISDLGAFPLQDSSPSIRLMFSEEPSAGDHSDSFVSDNEEPEDVIDPILNRSDPLSMSSMNTPPNPKRERKIGFSNIDECNTMRNRYLFIGDLVLALLIISLGVEGRLLNPDHFSQKLMELASKAGFSNIQEIYNSRTYSNSQLDGDGLVKEVASSLSVKFNGPIEAAKKIRDAVEEEEDRFTSNPSMPLCCGVSSTTYQAKFSTKVDLDSSCIRISATAPNEAKFPTSKIEEVMKQNYQDNPSLKWQFFASEDGHYMNYPALKTDNCDEYDPRFRPFYVETATPMPKDIVVILDRSGSMINRYNDKTLLQIAKEAAISVVETLNPNDRVSVVAFESEAKVLGISERSCLSNELAMATPINKKFLKKTINDLNVGSATNYEAALNTAFDVFARATAVNSARVREQVILFLTDGRKTKGGDPVQVIADRNKELENSVIVFTYALGNAFYPADRDVLKDMANQVKSNQSYGEVKKGQYNNIQDPFKLRSAMASYYNRFSNSSQLTNAIFSVPYIDLLGLGLLTSVCLPVYRKSGRLLGVACSDITLGDLLSTLTYFQAGDLSYGFIIDGTGRTLTHPLMPVPEALSDDPLFIHIDHLERQLPASEVINGMMMGESGSTTFNSKRTFPRGSVLYEGIQTMNFQAIYNWSPIENSNFSVAIVVAQNDTSAILQRTGKQPEAVHYHRLDLVSPVTEACKHFSRYSSKDFSVFMLTPKAFEDPFKYLDSPETLSDVRKYESFLKEETAINPGLKRSILESVKTTYKAEQFWKTAEISSLVVWQYIGTKDGVMRLFPAVTVPKNYDHTKRPWYLRTVSMKGKLSISAPYKDQWGSVNLITMSKTVLEQNSALKPVMGVMGTDLRLPPFYQLLLSTYTKCKDRDYRCFVLDSSGFIVIHEDFVQSSSGKPQIENVHIVYKEQAIADDMIQNGYMTQSNCLDLEHFKNQHTYRVTTIGVNRLTSNAKYQIYPVADTNVFIVIKYIHVPVISPCCLVYNAAPDKTQCNTARKCDCLCQTRMNNFNYCLNQYTLLSDAAPTCSPLPPQLLPLPVNEENLVRDLDVCIDYKCSEKSSKGTCNSIVGCDWCFRDENGTNLPAAFCGTVYQCRLGIFYLKVDPVDSACPECGEEKANTGVNTTLIAIVAAAIGVAMFVVIVAIALKRKGIICNKSRYTGSTSTIPRQWLHVAPTNPVFQSEYADVIEQQSTSSSYLSTPPPNAEHPEFFP